MCRQKPDSWYEQSAVVPFRRAQGLLEVLLVTTRGKGNWIVPKGIVEPSLSAEDSALKEAFEEGGVEGVVVGAALGHYEQRKWGGICRIAVYAMRVDRQLDDWPEAGVRRRQWMGLDRAAAEVHHQGLGRLIAKLPAHLESGCSS